MKKKNEESQPVEMVSATVIKIRTTSILTSANLSAAIFGRRRKGGEDNNKTNLSNRDCKTEK
jgi:hypothetical protein